MKVQIFQANGTAGAISTIAVAAIKPTSDAAPKAVFSEDGVVVAFDAFTAGTYGIVAFLLNNSGQLIAAKVLTSGGQPLVTTWLAYDSDSNGLLFDLDAEAAIVRALVRRQFLCERRLQRQMLTAASREAVGAFSQG